MAKYHLHLKGYVGARDFNTRDVDNCLKQNADNDVRVLIDSTGGSLATGLSIAAAFKNHGAVDVHFVGLNASAATVASLGARTVSMDRNAMYLVHKCSNIVFAWQSMNADELEQFINDLVKNKNDLDKIDDNIAAMYAARCRKDKNALLELMKVGGWLNSKEALDWGFIDKITDKAEDDAARITNSIADDLRQAGIPVPEGVEKNPGLVQQILQGCKKFFSAGAEEVQAKEPADMTEAGQESAPETLDQTAESPDDSVTDSTQDEDEVDEENEVDPEPKPQDAVENKAPEQPKSKTILDNHSGRKSDGSVFGDFIDTGVSARKLFNSLP